MLYTQSVMDLGVKFLSDFPLTWRNDNE